MNRHCLNQQSHLIIGKWLPFIPLAQRPNIPISCISQRILLWHSCINKTIVMGNTTHVCTNPCLQEQELVVKNTEQVITAIKGDKLEPIVFDSDRNSEAPSHIEKQSKASDALATPQKPFLSSTPSELTTKASKLTANKTTTLNLSRMVVVSEESAGSNHINDEVIQVPYSVIRLTMSARLRRTIDELGSQLLEKFEQQGSSKWKLHKKGYYLTLLGQDLYAVFTPNFYYEGELEEGQHAIVPTNQGILINEVGMYAGSFKGGRAYGKGYFRDVQLKTVYRGTWLEGIMEEGTIENDAFWFQGHFKGGFAHGGGKMIFKEKGFSYNGKFEEGLFHDNKGLLVGRNYTYEGSFEGGFKEGQGSLVQLEQQERHVRDRKDKRQKYHPAEQFEGKWHRDCFEGRGRVNEEAKIPKRR